MRLAIPAAWCWTPPRRRRAHCHAGISGRGVFRSNDGGANWAQVLSAATPVVAAAIGPAPNGFAKVVVALAPPTRPVPNPGGVQVLYVSLQGTGARPDPVGLFMSTNQGGAWVKQAAASMPTNTQGGYSFHFAVDPGSPGDGINDVLYFGAVGQARSGNSGNSFTNMVGLHADTHSWWIHSATQSHAVDRLLWQRRRALATPPTAASS